MNGQTPRSASMELTPLAGGFDEDTSADLGAAGALGTSDDTDTELLLTEAMACLDDDEWSPGANPFHGGYGLAMACVFSRSLSKPPARPRDFGSALLRGNADRVVCAQL